MFPFTYLMKGIFKKIIAEFQSESLPKLHLRDYSFYETKEVIVLIGLRRIGKTYLLYQEINKFPKKQCIYINFEDERLEELKVNDLQLIFEAHYDLFPETIGKELYLFFDEIQSAPSWELFINRLYESKKFRIYVTGSSAKLLSKEIATQLRGRVISKNIFPLSFKEFLKFKEFEINKLTFLTNQKSKLLYYFNEFFKFGGLPRVVEENEIIKKRDLLSTYMDLIIYKDLIDRYNIRNTEVLKLLIKYMITNIGKNPTLNYFYNSIKQITSVSKDSIADYFSYILDIGLLYQITQYSFSLKNQNIAMKKVYITDLGYNYIFGFKFSEDKGRLLENLVFIELKRRNKEIYYHREKHECDFVIKEAMKIKEAIQVCYELNYENKDREIKGLLEAMNKHKLKEGLLLTYDEEEEIIIDKKKIIIKPVWKYLLE
jgi:uncharacterized protein